MINAFLVQSARSETNPFAHDVVYHRIQQKKMQYVVNPVHPRKLSYILSPQDLRIEKYDGVLDNLAELVTPVQLVVLTGGLAIDATLLALHPETTPRFYREHYAVHLGVARYRFPELVKRAYQTGNYYPFSRAFLNQLGEETGTKKDAYYPLPWNEVEAIARGEKLGRIFGVFRKNRNIRLIRIEGETGEITPHIGLLDYMDVYLHYYRNGRLVSNDDHRRDCPLYFSGIPCTTMSDKKLPLVNIRYLEQIKSERFKKKCGETDRYDLERIAAICAELKK